MAMVAGCIAVHLDSPIRASILDIMASGAYVAASKVRKNADEKFPHCIKQSIC